MTAINSIYQVHCQTKTMKDHSEERNDRGISSHLLYQFIMRDIAQRKVRPCRDID